MSAPVPTLPPPMRLRTEKLDDKLLVRVWMRHDMESGQRKDAAGTLVPAWFIREVLVHHNDALVLSAAWGPGVSKNPTLRFTLQGVQPGDRLRVRWTDNRGESRTDEVVAT